MCAVRVWSSRAFLRDMANIRPQGWEAAKRLLQGVMDTVDQKIQGPSPQEQAPSTSETRVAAGSDVSSLFGSAARPSTSAYEEHASLFRFKPSSSKLVKKGRGKTPVGRQPKQQKATFWTKETICLRYTDQVKAPDTEEKMKLAQMGLGFKEIKFNTEGDSCHIHSTIVHAYPDLEFCGGYCLMRLGSGSSELVTVEPPRSGLNVRYLRDILKSAKLFVRPLQKDLEEKESEESTVVSVCVCVCVFVLELYACAFVCVFVCLSLVCHSH